MSWGDLYTEPDRKAPHPGELKPGDTVELDGRPGEPFGVIDVRLPLVELQAPNGARLKAGFKTIRWPREGAQ